MCVAPGPQLLTRNTTELRSEQKLLQSSRYGFLAPKIDRPPCEQLASGPRW